MILKQLTQAPKDPILSLSAACQADKHPKKLDLTIGVYKDESGQTPIMSAVKQAQQHLLQTQDTKAYVGMEGNKGFNQAMKNLLLGESHEALSRTVATQTPGASGGLRLLADLIKLSCPQATIWLSDPSYANHAPIMKAAGLNIRYYPYFSHTTKTVDNEAMLEALQHAGRNDVVLLHGCCHNPTGADIDMQTWQALTAMACQQGFLPFIDIAYQGFGHDLDEDVAGFRYLAQRVTSYIATASCSKNFGLYRERTGLVMLACDTLEQSLSAQSRLLEIARTTYTMPPDHGAALVELILNDAQLRQQWQQELHNMQQRIALLRQRFASSLHKQGSHTDYHFITQHKGMFSMLGITTEQAKRLRQQHSIYIVDSGRINIAGLQEAHIDYIAHCLLQTTRQ